MSYRSEQDFEQSTSKQKVTLYLSPELHRNLKIRAAVEMEAMSVMAERALSFYLDHPDMIENAFGRSHQVHYCPECSQPLVLRQGELAAVTSHTCSSVILEDGESDFVQATWGSPDTSSKRDELVPC
ncbi:MAG: hypothetical protein NW237_06100 [Cyanobacteriota bacterium]|nr:hypothetical protein [Cyanobacteriota bacterium]